MNTTIENPEAGGETKEIEEAGQNEGTKFISYDEFLARSRQSAEEQAMQRQIGNGGQQGKPLPNGVEPMDNLSPRVKLLTLHGELLRFGEVMPIMKGLLLHRR